MAPKTKISIDVEEFLRTRDKLATAFLTLSAQADKVAKAYVEHTNTVLTGAEPLNLSTIAANINLDFSAAQFAVAAATGASTAAPVEAAAAGASAPAETGPTDGKKQRRKREVKVRDPNAPKRPLTAYFRFLGEVRPQLTKDLAQGGGPRKAGDVSAAATERWAGLTEAQKKPYHDAYQAAKALYEADIAKYNAKTGKSIVPTTAPRAPVLEEVDDDDDEDEEEDDDDDDNIDVSSAIQRQLAVDAEEDSETTDSDSDETPAPPPVLTKPKTNKAPSPEAPKKTPKKKPVVMSAPTPVFNSINPTPAVAPTPKKRKSESGAGAGDDGSSPPKKKRGRPSNASLAAAAALNPAGSATPATQNKEKKVKSSIKKTKPVEA